MTKTQFYRLLDELMELNVGTIKGEENLASLSQWDSLALMGFIALLDQHFGVIVPASRITECKTVQDLVALTGGKVQ